MKLLKFLFLLLSFIVHPLFCKQKIVTKPIGFLFAHGFGGTKDQIHWYREGNSLDWHILGVPCSSFNFPEVNAQGMIDKNKVNLGQEDDIEAIKQAHEKFCIEQKVDSIVLVGVSRGASAIITYAETRPKRLKALILESPYDTVENVIYYQLKRRYIGYIPGVSYLVCRAANAWYPKYKQDHISPLKSITKLDPHLPILFIHSKEDSLVPFSCGQLLYKKLKEKKFKHVYFLELEKGIHAKYQQGSDALRYRAGVQAFYQKYGIPHDKDLAQKGKKYLQH